MVVTQTKAGTVVIYQFRCPTHGLFEVEQPMLSEHKANCPKCGQPAQRIYTPTGHYWDNPKPLYHEDGSYEEKY